MTQVSMTQKVLNLSFVKILVGLILCVTVVMLAQTGLNALLGSTSLVKDQKQLLIGIAVAGLSIGTYILLFRVYEKRSITELSVKGLGKSLSIGICLGVVLQSLTILVMYLNKGFTVMAVNSVLVILPSLAMAFTSAIFEEILFRGIVFRITEEKLGSYWALLISALLFGAMHSANPNSSLFTALGLAIQAGLLLAAAYIFTRNLWFPIAIHFAWNFTQSGIYGANTSGNSFGKSLLTTKIEGSALWTGGQFGPEGSLQATLFCLAAAVFLMVLNHHQQKLIKPSWKK